VNVIPSAAYPLSQPERGGAGGQLSAADVRPVHRKNLALITINGERFIWINPAMLRLLSGRKF